MPARWGARSARWSRRRWRSSWTSDEQGPVVEPRQVETEAVFDRLGQAWLMQAYRILVPEHRRVTEKGADHDPGSAVRPGVLGAPEGGPDHRLPDGRAEGACGRLGASGACGVGL